MDADSDDREGMDIEPTTNETKKTKQSIKDRNENLPWVEKYRPSDLSELISHTQITDTITKLIDSNKLPHLLFYGPPGTGKTSTILAVAKKIYGKNYSSMILELNASDDRGIDVVRKEIKDFANTRNIFSSGIKLIVLDEADAMTSAAQAALRRVIEKYTRTTRFCLICNYLNRIIPALQSRCTRFRFGPLRDEAVVDRLNQVAKIEGVNITKSAMEAVVKLGHGDMRKCLNILQSASMAYDAIDQDQIYQCTGHPLPKDISQILEWLLNQNFKSCMDNIITLQRMKGLALQDIITELHSYVLRIQINAELRIFLLEKLADIEFRLSSGSSEKLNLGALVSAFQLVRDRIASDNKMIP